MSNKRKTTQFYASSLYVFHNKKSGFPEKNIAATNLTALSKETGIPYGKLRYAFGIMGMDEYEDKNCFVLKVNVGNIHKGLQRVKGGGHRFGSAR